MTKKTASWHCHDRILYEWDSVPRARRIAYIKSNKPLDQQELRLRVHRPMSAKGCRLLAIYDAAMAEADRIREGAMAEAIIPLEVLHKIECPDCPWDGKTIFPGKEATP